MLQIPLCALCLIAGIPFGLLLKTNYERQLRGNGMPWLPFGAGSPLRLFIGIAIKLLLVLPIFFLPLWMALELGRRFALSYTPVGASLPYLAGILIGKAIRFRYWRRK